MSTAVKVTLTKGLTSLSLFEFISPSQNKAEFPFNCLINNNEILLTTALALENLVENESTVEHKFIPSNSTVELIVFSTVSFAFFLELISSAKLTLHALNAINFRNNLTSYRFTVTTSDFIQARKDIAELALANNEEVALIDNAPLLNQPGVLVMDMDSTTIEIECIDEIAVLAGVGEQVAEVTELAMQGQLDFAQSLHQRVATLTGSSETILAEVAKDIPLMPGLTTLVEILQQHHWRVAIASGGFTYFADHLKAMLNLDAAFANVLEIVDGTLTGKVLGDVVDAQAKADCLKKLQAEYHLPPQQTVAMGDGANDLVMMAAASLGVAFHAKPVVLAQADTTINHLGLDCLIHWLK